MQSATIGLGRGRHAAYATPTTMDIRPGDTYFVRMIARLIAMLAILAVAIVTTVTPAHAAGMGMASGMDHAMHVGETMHAQHGEPVCDADRQCGPTSAGLCEIACTSLSAVLAPAGGEAEPVRGAARHGLAAEALHTGRAPGLNDRPPKHHPV